MTGGEPEYVRDVFFEDGGYVYNVAVTLRSGEEEPEAAADDVLNSIEVSAPDKAELGTLIRADAYTDETYTVNVDDWSIAIPVTFGENYANDSMAMYTDDLTSVSISVDTDGCFRSARTYMSDHIKAVMESRYSSVVETVSLKKIGRESYMTSLISTRSGGRITYSERYAALIDGKAVVFTAEYPERAFSTYNRELIQKIIASLRFD